MVAGLLFLSAPRPRPRRPRRLRRAAGPRGGDRTRHRRPRRGGTTLGANHGGLGGNSPNFGGFTGDLHGMFMGFLWNLKVT